MNSRAIILLSVALVLAGGAAWLTSSLLSNQQRQNGTMQAVEKPTVNVLVAKNNLPQGTILKAEQMQWQAWPDETLNQNYYVEKTHKITDLVGRVLRHAVVSGTPITNNHTVAMGEQGYVAAILRPGMRAVTIPISRTTGLSGLVFPGDRVDILLTHGVDLAGSNGSAQMGLQATNERQVSETILENVRVLAIDMNTNDQSDKPELGKAVTLELPPKLTEVLTLAQKLGNLSLSLRSLAQDQAEGLTEDDLPRATGKSYTWDAEVSPLIPPINEVKSKTLVRVSRGGAVQTNEFAKAHEANKKGASQ